ncbi:MULTISPECIES: helix-turn-helix transcriptional regulator [unclassified Microbacterium]|uniref:helix-turn-helix transcriptional regulator n=1 Tax=unclassified Microbacterium TaxID=2609290 RepID=UPI0019278A0A|nr:MULTISPECIES: helix-turn-helix domain-containing protein [unclassified Microbacterium]
MTPTDAAAYLGRSVAALAQLRYRGTGPTYIRAGGRIRYRESAIQAWLDEGERDAT